MSRGCSDKRTVRFMQGNEACVEAAIAAGVRFFAGYPITPANEIANLMAERLPRVGGIFIQMEDEIASICAAVGASLVGLKSMDATSGPGFSLKQEMLGLAYMVEVPLVLVNVQRVGPSIGMATSPAQGDVMQSRYGSHGDYAAIVLSPSSVQDMFDLTVKAVSFSEEYRVPVILLADQVVGHMRQNIVVPPLEEIEVASRRLPSVSPQDFHPYRPDERGVPEFAPFGTAYRWYANSSAHDEDSFQATSNYEVAQRLIERLSYKIEANKERIVNVVYEMIDDAEIAVIAYGCTAISALGAVKKARQRGIKVGLCRPRTLWPVPDKSFRELAKSAKALLVVELNMGQYVHVVEAATRGCSAPVYSLCRPVMPFYSREILSKIEEVARRV